MLEGLKSVNIVVGTSLAQSQNQEVAKQLFKAAMNYRHDIFSAAQKKELEGWIRGSKVLKSIIEEREKPQLASPAPAQAPAQAPAVKHVMSWLGLPPAPPTDSAAVSLVSDVSPSHAPPGSPVLPCPACQTCLRAHPSTTTHHVHPGLHCQHLQERREQSEPVSDAPRHSSSRGYSPAVEPAPQPQPQHSAELVELPPPPPLTDAPSASASVVLSNQPQASQQREQYAASAAHDHSSGGHRAKQGFKNKFNIVVTSTLEDFRHTVPSTSYQEQQQQQGSPGHKRPFQGGPEFSRGSGFSTKKPRPSDSGPQPAQPYREQSPDLPGPPPESPVSGDELPAQENGHCPSPPHPTLARHHSSSNGIATHGRGHGHDKSKPAEDGDAGPGEEVSVLLSKQKLCLVLDLDHTLLNSARFSEVDPEAEATLHQRLATESSQQPDQQRRELFKLDRLGMWTKLRPGARGFLQRASQMFELWIHTNGTKAYAEAMVELLDPGAQYFAGRIIAQGSTNGDDSTMQQTKRLMQGLEGREPLAVILDDSSAVWPHDRRNLLMVERYIYYPSSRRKFGMQGKALLEINRCLLLSPCLTHLDLPCALAPAYVAECDSLP